MLPESVNRIDHARSASGDELKTLVHEASEDALLALLENPNLDEPHVVLMLERLDLPATVLSAIAGEGKWTASEGVRLRLARHPRTPKRFALAAVRQLFLFDLVRLSMQPSVPADIRRVAEEVILTRIPHIPVGEKLTLARRGPPRVAGALLVEGHAQAVKLVLTNPFLTESQVLKALANRGIPERAVVAVARHPKWSTLYNVRTALVRNPHTPAASILEFLPQLTLSDLKDASKLDDLAPHLKKYIQQELSSRVEKAETPARKRTL